MPYSTPTASQLKARYPEFATVDDTVVDGAITDALGSVSESWREEDYQPAVMLLACHFMTMEGRGSAPAAQIASVSAGVSRIKSGDLDVTLSDKSAANANNDPLLTTIYGTRFADMRRRNFPPLLIF